MMSPKLLKLLITFSFRSLGSLSTSLAAHGGKSPDICTQMTGLERRQKRVCRQHLTMMAGVMKAANMSITECQFQFKDRRWNCSMIDQHSIFGSVINKGWCCFFR